MKKTIWAVSILAAVGLTSILSCSKEERINQYESGSKRSSLDLQINRNIENFKKELSLHHENLEYKSGEILEPDSALCLLEATINYSHAFPNEFYSEMEISEFNLILMKNGGGKVEMGELVQKYEEMKDSIKVIYYNSAYDPKGLVLVDLGETIQTIDYITIHVETMTGQRGVDPIPGPFVAGDDWWYGEDEGKCYLPVYSSDAAQELMNYMNDHIADKNNGFFFVHQVNVFRKGGDPNTRRINDPDPPNNVYDYYLYSSSTEYGTITSDILCLDYSEMNVYYNFLEYLLYTKIPGDEEFPPAFRIEKIIEMEGEWEEIEPYIHYYHEGNYKYGHAVAYEEGDGPVGL